MQRRSVLKTILVLLFPKIAISENLFDERLLSGNVHGLNNQGLLKESKLVWKAWKDSEFLEPLQYLIKYGVDTYGGNTLIEHIHNDFQVGRIMEIQGLTLSKTEAALLAELGRSIHSECGRQVFRYDEDAV